MLLHYYPRNLMLRGCAAVPPDQGGHSVCMYEAEGMLRQVSGQANKLPLK